MSKNQILREMGIQVWVSREPKSADLEATQIVPTLEKKIQEGEVSLAQTPAESDESSPMVEMKWTILHEPFDSRVSNLFKQIHRLIETLGVSAQYLEIDENFQPTMIQGQVVVGLGQKIGQIISGERDSIENLRGILFDLHNQQGEEIPAVITYSLRDLISSGRKKSSFWDDLLWARSIWFESRLY